MSYINMVFAVVFFGVFSIITLALLQLKYKWMLKSLFENIICFCLVGGLLTVTLFPVPLGAEEVKFSYTSNFIPFHSIQNYVYELLHGMKIGFIHQCIGNIALFVIVMFILCCFFQIDSWKRALKYTVAFSVLIEGLQGVLGLMLGVFYRSVDIDDVILNTIGGAIGYVIYRQYLRITKSKNTNKKMFTKM
ncbi:MAG: VanZ family protein [Anaerostipes sp.]|nr:VanZ family protein [Anaerostipes sp.]